MKLVVHKWILWKIKINSKIEMIILSKLIGEPLEWWDETRQVGAARILTR